MIQLATYLPPRDFLYIRAVVARDFSKSCIPQQEKP
jgi:hypothetical protein